MQLRPYQENATEEARLIEATTTFLRLAKEMPTITPCVRCDHHRSGLCDLVKGDIPIPEDQLLADCAAWEEGIDFLAVFADTGNEHPITMEYVTAITSGASLISKRSFSLLRRVKN